MGVGARNLNRLSGLNCGNAVMRECVFGVRYHPEASAGRMDRFYLFERFVGMLG